MIKTILIATDGSTAAENAGSFAIDLADQLKCDVYTIFVADAIEYLAGMTLAEMYLPMHNELMEQLMAEGEAALKKIEDMAKQKGVGFKSEVIKGNDPVKEIIDAAKKEGVDLIVVGSHGKKTAMLDLALGEIPPKLLASDAPCPITVVKPH